MSKPVVIIDEASYLTPEMKSAIEGLKFAPGARVVSVSAPTRATPIAPENCAIKEIEGMETTAVQRPPRSKRRRVQRKWYKRQARLEVASLSEAFEALLGQAVKLDSLRAFDGLSISTEEILGLISVAQEEAMADIGIRLDEVIGEISKATQ